MFFYRIPQIIKDNTEVKITANVDEAVNFSIESNFYNFDDDKIKVELDFNYDNETEYFSFMNFILDQNKKTELVQFIDGIKNDMPVVFDSDSEFYSDYPHRLLAFPYKNKYRFIVIMLEDYDNSEFFTMDMLVDKQVLYASFSGILTDIEKFNS